MSALDVHLFCSPEECFCSRMPVRRLIFAAGAPLRNNDNNDDNNDSNNDDNNNNTNNNNNNNHYR